MKILKKSLCLFFFFMTILIVQNGYAQGNLKNYSKIKSGVIQDFPVKNVAVGSIDVCPDDFRLYIPNKKKHFQLDPELEYRTKQAIQQSLRQFCYRDTITGEIICRIVSKLDANSYKE